MRRAPQPGQKPRRLQLKARASHGRSRRNAGAGSRGLKCHSRERHRTPLRQTRAIPPRSQARLGPGRSRGVLEPADRGRCLRDAGVRSVRVFPPARAEPLRPSSLRYRSSQKAVGIDSSMRLPPLAMALHVAVERPSVREGGWVRVDREPLAGRADPHGMTGAGRRHRLYITSVHERRAMPPPYAELHCLSNFTFLRGASHPEELVARALRSGMALALTDECSLAGVVRAHVAAKTWGLALLIGTEVRDHRRPEAGPARDRSRRLRGPLGLTDPAAPAGRGSGRYQIAPCEESGDGSMRLPRAAPP